MFVMESSEGQLWQECMRGRTVLDDQALAYQLEGFMGEPVSERPALFCSLVSFRRVFEPSSRGSAQTKRSFLANVTPMWLMKGDGLPETTYLLKVQRRC